MKYFYSLFYYLSPCWEFEPRTLTLKYIPNDFLILRGSYLEYIAQSLLKRVIPLSHLPECWNYRPVQPCPAIQAIVQFSESQKLCWKPCKIFFLPQLLTWKLLFSIEDKIQGFEHIKQVFCHWTILLVPLYVCLPAHLPVCLNFSSLSLPLFSVQ